MTHTICQIITKLELGGAQQTTLYVVAHLDRTRFRPILISGEPGLLDEEAKALEGVEFYQVPSLMRPIRPWQEDGRHQPLVGNHLPQSDEAGCDGKAGSAPIQHRAVHAGSLINAARPNR